MRIIVTCLALVSSALGFSAPFLSASVALAQTGSIAPAPAAPAAAAPGKALRISKSAVDESMAECMRLWDSGTHMSKQEWSRTCQRIQTRLDNLKVESLDVMGLGVRKKPAAGKQGSVNQPGRTN
jgi:hypothetical protein